MKSKGYVRFCNRLQYFVEDNEVITVLLKNKENLAGGSYIFNGVTEEDTPTLYSRDKITPHARKLAIHHLRRTLLVSFIKDLYEEVTEYLKYILFHASKNGAEAKRLLGENNRITLDANTILSASNINELRKMVTEQIFQQLENERSTINLIGKIDKKLDLQIPQDYIFEALPYLEIRHIFVHSDGKPNNKFIEGHPNFKLDQKGRIDVLKLSINEIREKITTLVKEIDKKMLEKNFFSDGETQN